jgi:hypothetical protein
VRVLEVGFGTKAEFVLWEEFLSAPIHSPLFGRLIGHSKAQASDVAMEVHTDEIERFKKQVETIETFLHQLLSSCVG